MRKGKIFEFQSNFLSFCVRNSRYLEELFGQLFNLPSRLNFLQLTIFPFSISQENCRNFSESKEFFYFQSNFLCFGFNKSYVGALLWLLFALVSGFHFFISSSLTQLLCIKKCELSSENLKFFELQSHYFSLYIFLRK